MPIQSGDIKLLAAQVLLDTPEGGGTMTGIEVVDGQSNNLFPDISELDRTYGRLALRKTFAAVLTDDTDSYYGAHAIISRMPTDPRVGVTLLSTADWFDRRTQARDKIERYLVRSSPWAGHLLGTQLAGQRSIQLAVRETDEEPKVGQGLCLIGDENTAAEFEQYVRVTKVSSVMRIFVVAGKDVSRKVLTIELSDPLRFNFLGPSVAEFEAGALGRAACRDTRVADAASYHGISPLAQGAAINDARVFAASLFTQLVPSALSETPMTDLTAASMNSLYVPGHTSPILITLNAVFSAGQNLYLGSPVMPGSLRLSAGANVITDTGGLLMYLGSAVGSIEYDKGLLRWNASVFSYAGGVTVLFQPAAVPQRVADTASISIVQDSRGFVYTITLLPLPMPMSLVVSYTAQGKVYYLYDRGDGTLRGADAAFGVGSVSYVTGSVVITTGALPDAGSEIIFAWGKRTTTFIRTDMLIPASYFEFTLQNPQVTPGQVQINWTVNGVAQVASDDGNGNFTGDATGKINYGSGKIRLVTALLVQKGTEFTIEYQWGPPNEKTFPMPVRSANGDVAVTIPGGGGIVPKSVEITWNVNIIDSPLLDTIFVSSEQRWNPPPPWAFIDPLVQGLDNGNGTLRRGDGSANPGHIDYVTGQIAFTPEVPVKIPRPLWVNVNLGSQTTSRFFAQGGNLETTATTWRRTMTTELVNSVATMPYDETGYVIVKWRTAAGSTAATEMFVGDKIVFDLTPGYAETILGGSVRFVCGDLIYIDRLGGLYHSINPLNGSGVEAGEVQYQSGKVTLTSWLPGKANALQLQSLVTEVNMDAVDEVVFRAPIAPIRPGSVQIRAVPIDGGRQVSVTADNAGKISGSGMIGTVDYQSGVVRIRFGVKRTVDASVTSQPWFVADAVFSEDGVQKIIQPKHVYPESIRYNAVGYTYLPLAANILGLDPVRLPSDGRVPIFRVADVVVVHNTQTAIFPQGAGAGTVLDVGRDRLSYIKVYDQHGQPLDPNMYTTDLDEGLVTLNSHLALGSLSLPLVAEHRVEDMALVTDVQINGLLTLNKPLTHAFPPNTSYVSSALIITDMRARAFNVFSQEAWTGLWQNHPQGNTIIAQYNEVQYPLSVTNQGAAEEHWALIFTSSSAFRVVGKSLGQIATGNINTDLAPLNPATQTPFFTLSALGFGGGWSAGNVLRFNTAGANYPLWIARTVLQGPATALNDSFQLQLRGDIDR